MGLVASLLLWNSWSGESGTGVPDSQPAAVASTPEPTTDSIAILTRAVEAAWGDMTLPTKVGAPLSAGTVKLASGLAQLEFHSGAAELGNWGVYSHRTGIPIRSLTGRIDEFMIFATALGPDEIRRLARFGQPSL